MPPPSLAGAFGLGAALPVPWLPNVAVRAGERRHVPVSGSSLVEVFAASAAGTTGTTAPTTAALNDGGVTWQSLGQSDAAPSRALLYSIFADLFRSAEVREASGLNILDFGADPTGVAASTTAWIAAENDPRVRVIIVPTHARITLSTERTTGKPAVVYGQLESFAPGTGVTLGADIFQAPGGAVAGNFTAGAGVIKTFVTPAEMATAIQNAVANIDFPENPGGGGTPPPVTGVVTFDPAAKYALGSGFVGRSFFDRGLDRPFITETGALCDPNAPLVKDRYASLALAQSAFPNAGMTSTNYTTRTVDTAAVRNADGAAVLMGRRVAVRGRLMLNESFTIRNIALDLSEGVLDPMGQTVTLGRRPTLPDGFCFDTSGVILLPDDMKSSPLWWGARPDVEELRCTIGTGSNSAGAVSRTVSSADVGKVVTIMGAGPIYANKRVAHVATVTAASGTTLTLSAPAGFGVVNAKVQIGSNSTPALDRAFNASDVCRLGKGLFGAGAFIGLDRHDHRIYGAGREKSAIARLGTFTGAGKGPILGDRGWNGGGNYQGVCRLEDIEMRGMAEYFMVQTLDADNGGVQGGPTGGDGERSFSFGNFREVWVSDCGITWSRRMGGVAERAGLVRYYRNKVFCTLRDGLSAVNCLDVIIAHNNAAHVGDDAFPVHTSATVSLPPGWQGIVDQVVIEKNVVDDAHGIKLCGGRRARITGNDLRRCKKYGVCLNIDNNQGRHSCLDVSITDNDIRDMLPNRVMAGSESARDGILINVPGAGKGAEAKMPGYDYRVKPEEFLYASLKRDADMASNTAPGLYSQGLQVFNNRITWRSDGSNIFAGREAGKEVWSTTGWVATPNLGYPVVRDGESVGVHVLGGIDGMQIAGNLVYGGGGGVRVDDAGGGGRRMNIMVQNNAFVRLLNYGIANESADATIIEGGNLHNLDPIGEAAGANANGTWAAGTVLPTALISNGKGAIVSTGSHFRRCYQLRDNPGRVGLVGPVLYSHAAGYGIGSPPANVGERYVRENQDFGSASFGQVTGVN